MRGYCSSATLWVTLAGNHLMLVGRRAGSKSSSVNAIWDKSWSNLWVTMIKSTYSLQVISSFAEKSVLIFSVSLWGSVHIQKSAFCNYIRNDKHGCGKATLFVLLEVSVCAFVSHTQNRGWGWTRFSFVSTTWCDVDGRVDDVMGMSLGEWPIRATTSTARSAVAHAQIAVFFKNETDLARRYKSIHQSAFTFGLCTKDFYQWGTKMSWMCLQKNAIILRVLGENAALILKV